MSLKPHPIQSVPEETARVAHAAFPHGTPYLTFRDELGPIFQDEDFTALFPTCAQPGLPPWRLALVTLMQFRENLADRQAAEAVRAGIDWKYLLGLELSDPGFDFPVLSEFRDRLLAGRAEALLLDILLERCRALGLLKARGQQRTDATHVLAAIRVLNRLELVAETLRAALNDLATIAPTWLQNIVPPEWYKRYAKRSGKMVLPCWRPWTPRRPRLTCGRCRALTRCAGRGTATTNALQTKRLATGSTPSTGCGSGPIATCRRPPRGLNRPTTLMHATVTSGIPSGPAIWSTSVKHVNRRHRTC